MKPLNTKPEQEYYENNLQYLQDELKRIDLLIYRKIIRLRQERDDNTPDEYRGLFISEEEIESIVKKGLNPEKKKNRSASDETVLEKIDNYLQDISARISKKKTVSFENGFFPTLHYLSYLFHLTPFEIDCLLVCMAPELDLRYQRLFAYIQNDVTKKRPTQ